MDLGMPITLVVKAPNQKIEDQTIECALGWTIKDLKEHISNVYPSKPLQNQQKLIYSGRLLNDHLMLKDVLRSYDEEPAVHTVHLVCSHSQIESTHVAMSSKQTEKEASVSSSSSSSVEVSPTNTPPVSPSQEGVRRRNIPTDSTTTTTEAVPIPNTTTTTPAPQPMPDAFNNMYAGNMMYGGAYYPGMVPGMMPFSPEQMMWFQQMYAQQMAQYMQLYQAGAMPQMPATSANTPGQPPQPEPVVNQNVAGGHHQPAPPRDAPLRMNAQGGMVMDDDDDDMNRDWLDWTYTFTRIAVLLSIVYFYSTFGRFLLVLSLFIAAYVYQAGWFGVQRRNPAPQNPEPVPPPQPEPQQAPPPQQPPPPPQPSDVGERQGEENVVEETSEDEDTTAEEASGAETAEAPRPRPLAVAWSFIYTFFSSLIPEQPAAVNAN